MCWSKEKVSKCLVVAEAFMCSSRTGVNVFLGATIVIQMPRIGYVQYRQEKSSIQGAKFRYIHTSKKSLYVLTKTNQVFMFREIITVYSYTSNTAYSVRHNPYLLSLRTLQISMKSIMIRCIFIQKLKTQGPGVLSFCINT